MTTATVEPNSATLNLDRQALLDVLDGNAPAEPGAPQYVIHYGWEDDDGSLHWLEETDVDDRPLRRPLGNLEIRCIETAVGKLLLAGYKVCDDSLFEARWRHDVAAANVTRYEEPQC